MRFQWGESESESPFPRPLLLAVLELGGELGSYHGPRLARETAATTAAGTGGEKTSLKGNEREVHH